MNRRNLKFPSGRPITRAKQDAKKLSKENNISLHEALNIVAKNNGMSCGWSKSLDILKTEAIK